MTLTVVRLADCAEVPWRNGGGVTRELWRRPAEGEFDARLSVANVASDGPFSEFPGVDRILVLLQGDGMSLRFTDDATTVELSAPLDHLRFAGERPVEATLRRGPTLDLNLMWRRTSGSASSAVVSSVEASRAAGPGELVLLVVGAGSATLPSGEVLAVGDTVIVDDGAVPAIAGDASIIRFVLT